MDIAEVLLNVANILRRLREIAKATFPLWKGRGIDLIN
jgi:hypothetical protein